MTNTLLDGGPHRVAESAKSEYRHANRVTSEKLGLQAAERTDEELLNQAFPLGILHGFSFDPNKTDEIPGEWVKISTFWQRVK